MSARHPETLATITKNRSLKKVNDAFSTIQKIATYQIPIPPPPLPVAGGGISTGSGTQYPILYPIAELGNQTNTIVINLANQNLHYQKLVINTAGTTTISFDGLLLNKAIVFTLDVSIGIAGVTAVNWPANLFNLPTLPITNGSRYVLYISGFRDGTEERYEVVGSSLTGSSTPANWSTIVIDSIGIVKDMRQGSLTDLAAITFGSSDGKLRQVSGPVGTGIIFDLGTAGSPLSGESYYFKNSNVELFRIESTDVLSSVSILPSTTALNLGDNTTHRWQNIFISNRVFHYEGATNQYLQIYKSTATHAAIYDIEDVVNPVLAHSFFANGGASLFSIVSGDSIYASLPLVPFSDNTTSIGAITLNRWKNVYISGRYTSYEGTSTTQYLEMFKDTITHNVFFNMAEPSPTSKGILFTINGGAALLSIIYNDSIYAGEHFVPTTNDTKDLGASTGNAWRNIYMGGRLFAYEGTLLQYAQVYKSTSIHDLVFDVEDVVNTHVGYSFFVNGGTALFQIQGGSGGNAYFNLTVLPLANQTWSLGSSTAQWNNLYLGSNLNIYEPGSTSKFLQIHKVASQSAKYNFADTASGFGHEFQCNGSTVVSVDTDNTFSDVGYLDFWQPHLYTTATGGGASALPSAPVGYLIVIIEGTHRKIPYYAV